MIDHDECEAAIAEAMRYGKTGWAEYLATRCDRQHQATTEPEEGA